MAAPRPQRSKKRPQNSKFYNILEIFSKFQAQKFLCLYEKTLQEKITLNIIFYGKFDQNPKWPLLTKKTTFYENLHSTSKRALTYLPE
jgi:hypothetical protein